MQNIKYFVRLSHTIFLNTAELLLPTVFGYQAIFRGSGSRDGDLTVQQMIEKYKI